MIVAHTVKGKGVSFMEGECDWHGKAPNQEQFDQAMQELCISEPPGNFAESDWAAAPLAAR